ncbi:MAG: hypothetical protein LLG04_07655 [Parachlamydia sp.]|nr:hypothetical protein [Parachlamydia sp.]
MKLLLLISLCCFAELNGGEVKKIAVLICEKFERVPTHVDNHELILPFEQHDLQYEEVIWDDPSIDLSQYAAVLVRATWDYIDKREQFLERIRQISSISIPLFNSLETLEWNSKKNYLLDLEKRGVPIIPTRILLKKRDSHVENTIQEMPSKEYIIKPAVSGGAHRTFRTNVDGIQQLYDANYTEEEEVLIQPFIPEIVSEGEWFLIFFEGSFSHAVLSKPAANDFRVQRMHGGTVSSITPSQEILKAARKVLECIPGGIPLYARVDFVRQGDRFLLMELELIEPCLFIKFDFPGAAERFSKVIYNRLTTYPKLFRLVGD